MAVPQATITVTVVGGALVYTVTGDGVPVTPQKHRVKKKTEVKWCCPDGALGVIFSKTAFTTGETVLKTRRNDCTLFKTTKNSKKSYKYTAVVAPSGSPDLIIEDPILDVSDEAGGGGKVPKPVKKAAPKKKKK